MSDGPTISDRIESAVEGLLRFFVRFGYTTWTIFRHPLTGIQRVAAADPASKTYVLPLSYLAIGGFSFALVISAFPYGFLNLVNIIWFDDEISRIIYERYREAFTITGLLSAAFPVFFCVTICASLAKRILCKPHERHTFTRLNHYAFGYQTFILFVPMVFLIFLDVIVSAINGPSIKPTLDPQISDSLAMILIGTLAIALLSALLLPALSLSYWRYQFMRTEKSRVNLLRQMGMPIYAIVVFVLVSYVASLPALLAGHFRDKPPRLELEIVGDPFFLARATADGSIKADARLSVVFHNNPDKALIAEARDISLFLVHEQDGADPEFLRAENGEVRSGGAPQDILVIPARQALVIAISGSIPLPTKALELIRDKAMGSPIGNDYRLFLGVRFSRGGTTLERSIAFDTNAALATLP